MKNRGLCAILFTLLTFTLSAAFSISRAADTDTSSGESIGDLINSAKQIGGKITEVDLKAPASIWGSIDGWFLETTGIHIVDAFKAIGHFIVWFLELVLSLFKWILSLVE